jgi:hypothetical protein
VGSLGFILFPKGVTMIKTQVGLVAALSASIVFSGHLSLLGADSPVVETMKSHGLKPAGDIYIVVTESDVKTKVQEVRRISKQLSYALMQQKGTLSANEYQQTIKGMGDQLNQYRTEINAVNQQMNALPRFRNRLANNYAVEQYQELQIYRNQLQAEANQGTQFLNQLRSRPYDPKTKDKADAEVQSQRESYHQALLDLRQLVDSANKKYAEASENEDVQQALGKLEKEEAGDQFQGVEPKPGRSTKRSQRGKRSARPASSAPAPSSTPEASNRF